MKRYLVFGLLSLCLVVSACAKKQTVAPEDTEAGSEQGAAVDTNIDSAGFAEEPSIRDINLDSKSTLSIIYFTLDSSNVSGEALDTLKANANYLKNNPKVNIVIEGHCDERGTTEYNLALGQRRAVKIKEYYVQLGVSPKRIATVSYGEEMPADKRNNEAGWAKNRRAETKVIVNK